MKNLKAPFLVIALLLNVLLVTAGSEHPPKPMLNSAKGVNTTAGEDDDCEDLVQDCDNGAGIPIDQNIIFLAIGGLALGLTVIYKNNIKKASI